MSGGNSWNISKCTFCTFNAFSGVDVRVEARIPGGVKSFTVDVLGIRKGTDTEGWQETFISSILRTLKAASIYPEIADDDGEFKVKRFIDGQFSLQTEMKILETATRLFPRGRQLGSPFGPHLAGNHDNFLTLGVVGYFCRSGRPEIAIGFLKGFAEKDSSLAGLLMKCFLLSSNQTNRPKIEPLFMLFLLIVDNQNLAMKMVKDSTFSSAIYPQLSDFLISRGDLEKADHFASESLKSYPNDFSNWRRLIQVKIARGQVEKALAILNNAPMTSSQGDGDFYKSLPRPVLISLPGTAGLSPPDAAHPSVLEKLKAPGLKGSYKEAYELLIGIYRAVGWDGLLNYRSKVFIMESELLGSGTNCGGIEDLDISLKDNEEIQIKSPLSEPVQLLSLPDTNFLSQTGKKLCERWLDNLILVLFEDLRIFSLFAEELKRNSGSSSGMTRSLKEWRLVGKLSMRLGHLEESKLAYQKCLFGSESSTAGSPSSNLAYDQLKMVSSSLTDLIQIYCKEGRVQLSLLCTLRLLNSQPSLYSSLLHPTRLSLELCGLVERVGLMRLLGELRAAGIQESEGKRKLDDFLIFVKDAKIHGYNY